MIGSRGPSPSVTRVSPTMDQGIQVGPIPLPQRRPATSGNMSPEILTDHN